MALFMDTILDCILQLFEACTLSCFDLYYDPDVIIQRYALVSFVEV